MNTPLSPANHPPQAAPDSPLRDFLLAYRANRGAMIGFFVLLLVVVLALFSEQIAPYAPEVINSQAFLIPPAWQTDGSSAYLLGTDPVGRDILSRIIFGARLSLLIGLSVVGLSAVLGALLGLITGYVGGIFDLLVMRLTDIMLTIPSLLLAIVIVAILGPSLSNAMVAVAIVELPHYVRIVRSVAIAESAKDYVAAARMNGASHLRILLSEIFPNCTAPIIVRASMGLSTAVLEAAALGFLGLGAQPPTPEWGTMLADAREFVQRAWWVVTFPGIAILLTVLAFNLVGDGIRDALDPKLKR